MLSLGKPREPAAGRRSADHLAPLTTVRTFAASGVLLIHIGGEFYGRPLLPDWPLVQCVSMFFVLSGFILATVYPALDKPGATVRFWIARAARLWPVHVFCLALLYLLLGDPKRLGVPYDTLLAGLANLFLVHAWLPIYNVNFAYNSLAWTISTEFGFYVLFPFLIHRFERTWWWKLACAAGLVIGAIALCNVLALNETTVVSIMYVNPLSRLFEFVLGMCAALLWRQYRHRWSPDFLASAVLEVAAVVLVVAAMRATLPLSLLAHLWGGNPAQIWVMRAGPTALAVAFLFVILAQSNGPLSRVMSHPIGVFLGASSFAVYMSHQILLRAWVWYFDAPRNYLPTHRDLALIGFVVLVLMASSAIYVLVESPIRDRIMRRVEKKQRRTEALSSASAVPQPAE